MLENTHINEQLNKVREQIKVSCKNNKYNSDKTTLIAVSKTFPNEYITTAYDCGQRVFGENKIQELEVKVPALPDDIEWHMIGHLQSNKVGRAVVLADYIHSVDSVKLLTRIDRLAKEIDRCPKVFLEVNISGENSKFGLTKQNVIELVKVALDCKNLQLVGYMTMAPAGANNDELHTIFGSLRKLRDDINNDLNIDLKELSMGMSNDYKIAIEEGATFIRVGSSIFGKRSYQI